MHERVSNPMEYPILYELAKNGKKKQWRIFVLCEGDEVSIVKESGYVDGKLTTSKKEVPSGKNIGKKNETTKFQQAHLEAKSAWDKQVRMGYTEGHVPCVQKLLPMLATDGAKCNDAHIKDIMLGQPKLDGVRVMVTVEDDAVVCYSRTGLKVDIPHIESACLGYVHDGFYLDGELYSEDISFEELSGLFRTIEKDEKQQQAFRSCCFHIFDCYDASSPEQTFDQRIAYLQSKRYIKPLCLVDTLVLPKQGVQEQLSRFVEQGYEGLILRDPKGVYEVGKRSLRLIKMKEFQDAEYQIVDGFGGTGVDKDCVIWKCITKGGKSFHVRPRGTLESRKQDLLRKQEFIGKMLTVRYQNLSSLGVPRFPVGVAIRENY